jgi:secreted trypsin-like serine protease
LTPGEALSRQKIAIEVETNMKVACGAGAVSVVFAVACGSSPTIDQERTQVTRAAIQDGTDDTTNQYPFVVAVIEKSQQVGLCSGSLLAPNLVATARHCVSALTGSGEIDCATSTFGAELPPTDMYVTNAAKLTATTHYVGVQQILVPQGSDHEKVCGNDIALLILDENIALDAYVTPTFDPPMSDPRYSISVTAIGYGIDSPLDTTGMSAGTRRVRENVGLVCVPNDINFGACYSEPFVSQFLAETEFVSGNASTCEGDSGSGAFDQGSFDRGSWVSFGVLSRGATDVDSGTCVQPIYSRFDAWSSLLLQGATQAAAAGAYALPNWAGLANEGGAAEAANASALPDATPLDAQTSTDSTGTSSSTSPKVDGAAANGASAGIGSLLADGASCVNDGQCSSGNCVSTNDVQFVCASACSSVACSSGFECVAGYCFASGDAGPPVVTQPLRSDKQGGCGIAVDGGSEGSSLRWLAIALGAIALGPARRRLSNRIE